MAGRLETIKIGDVDVYVHTIQEAGTQHTSAVDKAAGKVTDAFELAKATIVAMGEQTVDVIDKLARSRAAHPDKVEVEFGLGFTAKGNVVVAEASAEATLKVKLVYELKKSA